MSSSPALHLGSSLPLDGGREAGALRMPAHHLVTHGVVVGMTGSGKTGLLMVMVEEALRAGIPVLMFDVKSDLPNLLLTFPDFSPESVEPWVEPGPGDARSPREMAEAQASERRAGLSAWTIGEAELKTRLVLATEVILSVDESVVQGRHVTTRAHER